MALYDSGLSLTSYVGLAALALGRDPERVGNAHPAIVPYGVFEAADGPLGDHGRATTASIAASAR